MKLNENSNSGLKAGVLLLAVAMLQGCVYRTQSSMDKANDRGVCSCFTEDQWENFRDIFLELSEEYDVPEGYVGRWDIDVNDCCQMLLNGEQYEFMNYRNGDVLYLSMSNGKIYLVRYDVASGCAKTVKEWEGI
ncbi:MAG: hypothetical protein ABII07_04375 [Patescibacteria group bacterium]|nr:hypothetical protein [Patescibacteria group bacterium]